MSYVTREVKITTATAKVFNIETEEIEVVNKDFFDDETEKQMMKAFENAGLKVLKITDIQESTFIGRMTKEYFALNCEYYKDER